MHIQNAANIVSIETISLVFAALMVWLSALVQHFSNISRRRTTIPYQRPVRFTHAGGFLWSCYANAGEQCKIPP